VKANTLGKRILIIGASRGIGLGFADIFSTNGWEVHATVRDDVGEQKLNRLSSQVISHRMDVRNSKEISQVATNLKNKPLDILLHNAGVYGKGMNKKDVIEINSIAPFNVVENLLPLVLKSSKKTIALLTSQMGARNGGATPSDIYGESKCALNDSFREVETSWRSQGVTAVVFHPGWVATDMGGRSAPISVKNSVRGMYHVLEQLKPAQSGSFLTWEGKKHPW